jgi:hypothetical protein
MTNPEKLARLNTGGLQTKTTTPQYVLDTTLRKQIKEGK